MKLAQPHGLRWSLVVLSLLVQACAAPAKPSAVRAAAPSPSASAPTDSGVRSASRPTEPEPQPAVAQQPVAPKIVKAAPPKPTSPGFKPLALSEAQLNRVRAVQPYVATAAQVYGVDADLINGVIWIESKFNRRARNPSGARGLMQLMPKTSRAMAKRIGRKNAPYNAEFSVHAGAQLLSILLKKFDGDEQLALFGYARGSGRVRAWQKNPGQPIPSGVQKFIARVRRAQATFAALGISS